MAESRIAKKSIRYFPVKNYVVFYTVDEEAHMVNILRFLHGTRDWQVLL